MKVLQLFLVFAEVKVGKSFWKQDSTTDASETTMKIHE